jgi:membrane protease YdiL (CAAX protease family)
MPRGVLVLFALCALACGPPMRPARTTTERAPSAREDEASAQIDDSACSSDLSLVFPGLGQLCQGRIAEGTTMATLGAAELGIGLGVGISRDDGLDGFTHPGAAVPLLALQDLWLYGFADAMFVEQRAAHMLYVPEDTPAELVIAPFNARVLGEPDVWLGTLIATGLGVALSSAVDESFTTRNLGDDANLFGRTFPPETGYPLAGGVGLGLFSHVAVAEEATFRGLLQSQMTRETNATQGWLGASIAFGSLHAANAAALPAEDRWKYLAFGVPYITVLGGYLGMSYRWHDYALAAPVAIHFWYDFLLSATFFAMDPGDSPLSARVAIPF